MVPPLRGGGPGGGGERDREARRRARARRRAFLPFRFGRLTPAARGRRPVPVPVPVPVPAPLPGPQYVPLEDEDSTWLLFSTSQEVDVHRRQTFVSYLNAGPSMNAVDIPGSEATLVKLSDVARLSSKALFRWTLDLKDMGFSLDGDFAVADFFIDALGQLKGRYYLTRKLLIANPLRTDQDMRTCERLIRVDILGGTNLDIPFSMCEFLSHLQHFGEPNRPLLMAHVALDSDLEQLTKYLSYYHKLEKIEQRDPTAHAAIIQRLSGSVNAQWLCPAMNNLHVHRAMRYTSGSQNSVTEKVFSFLTGKNKYVETMGSQMLGRRNGQAHLPKDYAVDRDGLQIALRAATAAMIAGNYTIATQMGISGAAPPGTQPLPDARLSQKTWREQLAR